MQGSRGISRRRQSRAAPPDFRPNGLTIAAEFAPPLLQKSDGRGRHERRYCAELFKERPACSAVKSPTRSDNASRVRSRSVCRGRRVCRAGKPGRRQQRRVYRGDQTERITIIDENGRARTRITVRPRSYLDGGTEVVPGERKFMDYALAADLQSWLAPTSSWDPNGIHRYPLPMPFELPGYNPVFLLL